MKSCLALAALACTLVLSAPALADQATAVQDVKGQPHAVDAQVDTSGNMYVLVKPGSVNWSVYAAALCQVVKPHQARIFRIRIIELTKAINTKPPATWARLAEGDCSR